MASLKPIDPNFCKVVHLIGEAGVNVLRMVFDSKFPPQQLAADLQRHHQTLLDLYKPPKGKRKVLSQSQWDKLYPPNGQPNSKDFDVTLLFCLIRSLCNLNTPVRGWDSLPPDADISFEADIARIKCYRNNVVAHANTLIMDQVTFNNLWSRIEGALIRITSSMNHSISSQLLQGELNALKHGSIDTAMEAKCRVLLHHLVLWYRDDQEIINGLYQLTEKVERLSKGQDKIIIGQEIVLQQTRNSIQIQQGELLSCQGSLAEGLQQISNNQESLGIELQDIHCDQETQHRQILSGHDTIGQRLQEIQTAQRRQHQQVLSGQDNLVKKMQQVLLRKDDNPSGSNINNTCGVDDDSLPLKVELMDYYRRHVSNVIPLSWNPSFKFSMEEIFTTLTLEEKFMHGQKQKVISLESIFDSFPPNTSESQDTQRHGTEPRRILIEGAPGTGKSTLCKRLLFEWANPKSDQKWKLHTFEMVFFLEARQIDKLENKDCLVAEIFSQLFDGSNIKENQLKEYLLECDDNQKKCLVILDGFDEIQSPECVNGLVELLQGQIMRNMCVLVTSRPGESLKFIGYFEKCIKNKGFNIDQSCLFVKKYASTLDQGQKVIDKIEQLIKHNSKIEELVSVPLILLFILIFAEEAKSTLEFSNVTQLYSELTKIVTQRYCKSKGMPYTEGDPEFESFFEGLMLDLGTIALEGLLDNKIIFNVDNINEKQLPHGESILKVGFLVRDYSLAKRNPRQTTFFLHKSIQEFCAAFKLAMMNKEEFAKKVDTIYLKELPIMTSDKPFGTFNFDRITTLFIVGLASQKNNFKVLNYVLCLIANEHKKACDGCILSAAKGSYCRDFFSDIDRQFSFLIECLKECSHNYDHDVFDNLGTLFLYQSFRNYVVVSNVSSVPNNCLKITVESTGGKNSCTLELPDKHNEDVCHEDAKRYVCDMIDKPEIGTVSICFQQLEKSDSYYHGDLIKTECAYTVLDISQIDRNTALIDFHMDTSHGEVIYISGIDPQNEEAITKLIKTLEPSVAIKRLFLNIMKQNSSKEDMVALLSSVVIKEIYTYLVTYPFRKS